MSMNLKKQTVMLLMNQADSDENVDIDCQRSEESGASLFLTQ